MFNTNNAKYRRSAEYFYIDDITRPATNQLPPQG